jgi:hypothetical protein
MNEDSHGAQLGEGAAGGWKGLIDVEALKLNGHTAANRPLHVVVGINVDEQTLIIITTYEPQPLQWADNFSRRIV